MGSPAPAGVVALFLAPDGHVIASAVDFNQARNGMPLEDSQRARAEQALAHRVVAALASPLLAKALDGFALDTVMRKMTEAGCRTVVLHVGGPAA
jgi:hypothetical protein